MNRVTAPTVSDYAEFARVGWVAEPIRNLARIGTGDKDTQDRNLDGRYPFFVRSQKIERIDSWSFDGEAVLTAGDGVGTGKVFHYIKGKFDYHQRVYRISDFRSDLLGKYFYYQFSQRFLARIESLTAKSSVDSVRMETIAGMEIPIPPKDEQERIVAALDDVESLIESLGRLITKKQSIKLGIMQQLLTGKTRLSGFTGNWVRLHVASKSTLRARIGWQGLTTDEYKATGEYRLVGGTEFSDGQVAWTKTPFVDRWRYDQDPGIQVRKGDVLLTKDGTVGKIAFVDTLPGPATLNSGVFVIRPTGNAYDSRFLYYMLRSRIFDDFLSRLTAGSTISHLYQRDLVGLVIDVPPSLEEQTAITSALGDLDHEIRLLKLQLFKTKSLQQGMMQELLSGRTRITPGAVAK